VPAGVLDLEIVHELIESEGIDAGAKRTIEGISLEGLGSTGSGSLSGEPAPECFVDDLPKGLTSLVRDVLELFGEVVVESDRRTHALTY
jgi:hypothetical protein